MKRTFSIPKPCHESWESMPGGERARFCQSCQRHVHDFSRLTRREVDRLIRKSGDGICARIAYQDDGEILFRPESKSKFAEHLVRLSMLGVSALAAQEPAKMSCGVTVKVTDPTGAPIPGAEVAIIPTQDPQLAAHGKADQRGIFEQTVAVGDYEVRVDQPGFQQFVRKDLALHCDGEERMAVAAPLKLGVLMGEVVEVAPPKPKRFSLRRRLGRL